MQQLCLPSIANAPPDPSPWPAQGGCSLDTGASQFQSSQRKEVCSLLCLVLVGEPTHQLLDLSSLELTHRIPKLTPK